MDSDTNDPPFGCSHILSTALMPAHGGGAGKYHNSVATDYWLPKQEDSNRAAKLNAWIYMMTVE